MGALARKEGLAPPDEPNVQNSRAAVLVAEARASCQQTTMSPDAAFTAILGRNWLRIGAAGSSFTRCGALHVPPLSSEKRSAMSVSLFSLTVSVVYTR